MSRELTLAFERLGADVIASTGTRTPRHGVADRAAVIKMNDAEALTALIEKEHPRYVVAEAERDRRRRADRGRRARRRRGVPDAAQHPAVLDREGLRRLAADELGLPTAPFWFAGSVDELTAITDHTGLPAGGQAARGVAGRGAVGAAAARGRRAGVAAGDGGGPDPAHG